MSSSIKNYARKAIPAIFYILIVALGSCQKIEDNLFPNQEMLKGSGLPVMSENSNDVIIYWGIETFKRETGGPVLVARSISNPRFSCFESDFRLKIRNGDRKDTRVSSAEIRIDGVLIAGPEDFSKNVSLVSKALIRLKQESLLEIKLNGAPGSFIDLWIEGTTTIITPSFKQPGPFLQNSTAPDLPATSDNGIKGTWSPEKINTSSTGTFTYTFTPNPGECGEIATMQIEITNSISDIEGNTYGTIKLGDQFWMSDNLKTTRYRNGDLIGTTNQAGMDISGENAPEYQWAYNGDQSNVAAYGRLYTWYAVTDTRNVCPEGWHVPTDAEWTTLTTYLVNNGYGFEGSGPDIGKSIATRSGWMPNSVAGTIGNDQISNNSSGFNAIPAGYRTNTGRFAEMTMDASWWSSTESNSTDVFYRRIDYYRDVVFRASINKKYGGAVRCVKD